MKENHLTISKICELLNQLKNEHGDIPVVIYDADTWWGFPLKEEHFSIRNSRELESKILQIAIEYGDEQID
jgi:hypothetical protein